ncbi:MAG: PQQ-dependent sugar dehydrogenase [Caulobacteraceae bacterium]|nr:PQQ-dependent sugar dehydrogenase [Caulobacteraceae bacterium]
MCKQPDPAADSAPVQTFIARQEAALRHPTIIATALLVLSAAGAVRAAQAPAAPAPLVENRPATMPSQHPLFPTQTRAPVGGPKVDYSVQTIASGLANPWGLAFLPDGKMLVTERPGRVRLVDKDGKLSDPLTGGPQALARGIGGMNDIVLDPNFAKNRRVYIAFNQDRPDGSGMAVFRGVLNAAETGFDQPSIIFQSMPAVAKQGDLGGRLLFDKTGALFVALGDETSGVDSVQSLGDTLGKILRIQTDGSPAANGPFAKTAGARAEIYALGVRDPEGLTLDAKGRLWELEHGPKGGDEVNLILPGKNYGWPVISYGMGDDNKPVGDGNPARAGMEQPIYYWDPSIGAGGLTFYTGKLFPAWKGALLATSLAQKHVALLMMQGDKVVSEQRLFTELNERIRNVINAPDGSIYLLTDSAQGRILRIAPK